MTVILIAIIVFHNKNTWNITKMINSFSTTHDITIVTIIRIIMTVILIAIIVFHNKNTWNITKMINSFSTNLKKCIFIYPHNFNQ
jgi:hypothetical protein